MPRRWPRAALRDPGPGRRVRILPPNGVCAESLSDGADDFSENAERGTYAVNDAMELGPLLAKAGGSGNAAGPPRAPPRSRGAAGPQAPEASPPPADFPRATPSSPAPRSRWNRSRGPRRLRRPGLPSGEGNPLSVLSREVLAHAGGDLPRRVHSVEGAGDPPIERLLALHCVPAERHAEQPPARPTPSNGYTTSSHAANGPKDRPMS